MVTGPGASLLAGKIPAAPTHARRVNGQTGIGTGIPVGVIRWRLYGILMRKIDCVPVRSGNEGSGDRYADDEENQTAKW